MPTLTGQNLIDRAAAQMHDTGFVRVLATEHLRNLCDGQRAIVAIRPKAYAKTVAHKTVAGTEQSIPNDGARLLDIACNMGTGAGATPGRAISIASQEDLDAYRPGWRAMAGADTTRHYMVNPKDPKTWRCYPPSLGNHYVRLTHSAVPADIAANAVILLDDSYAEPLILFMLYKAYSKDAAASSAAKANAAQYLAAFQGFFGIQVQADAVTDPNRQPPAPPVPVQGA